MKMLETGTDLYLHTHELAYGLYNKKIFSEILNLVCENEKKFKEAFAFYHTKPADYGVLQDLYEAMRRIALKGNEYSAWRLDADHYKDGNITMKEWLESLKEKTDKKKILHYLSDSGSFAAVGITNSDSAMSIFLMRDKAVENHGNDAVKNIINWSGASNIFGIQDEIKKLVNFSKEHLGSRFFQFLVNPLVVDEIVFLTDWHTTFNPSQKASEFLLTLPKPLESFMENIGEEGRNCIDWFDKTFQVRFRMYHDAFNNPKYTMIKKYYEKMPDEETLKTYNAMIQDLAQKLLVQWKKEGKKSPFLGEDFKP
jgi:hypothetical protein